MKLSQFLWSATLFLIGYIIIDDQAYFYFWDFVISGKSYSCESLPAKLVEKCLINRREFAQSTKSFDFVWILMSIFVIFDSRESFSNLRKIKRLKSNRIRAVCPECNYAGVSWDATTCPNCGSRQVDLTPLGNYLIFCAHVFIIYACCQVVFTNHFPSIKSTYQSTKNHGTKSSGQILKNLIVRSHNNLEKVKADIIDHYINENYLVDKIDLKYTKSEKDYQNISGTIDLSKASGMANIAISLKCSATVRTDNSFEWNCK